MRYPVLLQYVPCGCLVDVTSDQFALVDDKYAHCRWCDARFTYEQFKAWVAQQQKPPLPEPMRFITPRPLVCTPDGVIEVVGKCDCSIGGIVVRRLGHIEEEHLETIQGMAVLRN